MYGGVFGGVDPVLAVALSDGLVVELVDSEGCRLAEVRSHELVMMVVAEL